MSKQAAGAGGNNHPPKLRWLEVHIRHTNQNPGRTQAFTASRGSQSGDVMTCTKQEGDEAATYPLAPTNAGE